MINLFNEIFGIGYKALSDVRENDKILFIAEYSNLLYSFGCGVF